MFRKFRVRKHKCGGYKKLRITANVFVACVIKTYETYVVRNRVPATKTLKISISFRNFLI